MKVAFGSDLHFEFVGEAAMCKIIRSWVFEPGTQFLIIAGDLTVGADRVVSCLRFIYKVHGIHVIFVAGNHEYYHSSIKNENALFEEYGLETEEYTIMLHSYLIYDDVMICGCTGNLDGSYQKIDKVTHGALNDFHLISDFDDRVEMGKRERKMLENSLEPQHFRESIVVTHTMPSPKCIAKEYEGSYLNACFANDWESVIVTYKPTFWICGHTHVISSVKIDDTIVEMNPKGYPKENKNWKWRYIDV